MAAHSIRLPVKRCDATVRTSQRSGRPAARTAARSALDLQALQSFRTIFASARAHDAEVRRLAGISGSQLWALAEIGRSAGVSVNSLSERMAVHQTTASNLIAVLVERALIRRARDAVDQRVIRLRITTEGKKLLLQAPGPYHGLLVDALRSLNDRQLHKLLKCLAGVVNTMRRPQTTAAGESLLGE